MTRLVHADFFHIFLSLLLVGHSCSSASVAEIQSCLIMLYLCKNECEQMKIKIRLYNKYAYRGAIRNAPQQLVMFGRCVVLTIVDIMLEWVQVGLWGEVDRGFGRTGVQSFALEGVLGELQVII